MGYIPARRRRGVVLIIFALSSVAIFGFVGLAIDFGRLFIARNEAQGFCDAAAMAAASMLDGTSTGVINATNAVTGTYLGTTEQWKQYAFQTTTFASPTIQFSTDSSTWVATPPSPPTNYAFVKVTATAQLPMYISVIVTGQTTGSATASVVAGQVLKTTFSEGMLPLSILAHCTQPGTVDPTGKFTTCPCAQPFIGNTSGTVCTTQSDTVALGLAAGRYYTLRWPNNPFSGSLTDWCQGDGDSETGSPNTYNVSFQAGLFAEQPNERGFWESSGLHGDTSTYQTLLAGMMGVTLGGLANFDTSPSARDTISTALANRALNPALQIGYAPVIDPVTMQVVTVRAVLLVNGNYNVMDNHKPPGVTTSSYTSTGGGGSWCATYVGPAIWGTGGTAAGPAGIYEIRLVQ